MQNAVIPESKKIVKINFPAQQACNTEVICGKANCLEWKTVHYHVTDKIRVILIYGVKQLQLL